MLTPVELIEHANSRVKHPFLGSLTVALIVCNWKFFLTAFTGDLTAAQRIADIEALLSQTNVTNFIYPLVFAINVAIFYPVANSLANLFYKLVTIVEGNADSKLRDKIDENSELMFAKSSYLVADSYGKINLLLSDINRLNEYEFQVAKSQISKRLGESLVSMSPIVQGKREGIKEAYHKLKLHNQR